MPPPPWAVPQPPPPPAAPFGPPTRYVWSSEAEQPEEPVPGAGRRLLAAVLVALGIGVLGFAVGLLWLVISPRVPIVKVDGGYVYADAEPEQPIAADGWFLILGLAVGLVLAVAVWLLLRRYRGAGMLLGLTIGSLLGAWAAWWFGHKIGITDFNHTAASAPVGAHLQAPIELAITNMDPKRWWFPGLTGVVAAQALAAAFTYLVLAGFSSYENLRGPNRVRVGRIVPVELPPGSSAPPPAGPPSIGGDQG
jgi:hypothetical protein